MKDVNQLNHFVLKSYELLNQVPEKFSYYVQFSISNLENLCNEVRELFKLNRSISYLELKEALIEKNIHVFEWNLPMNISGISIRDELSIIIINYAHTTERKNFTLSHELAHTLFHLNEKDSKVTVSDIQSQEKIEEKISNLFAAELLMPSSDFDKIVAAYSSEIDKTIFLDLIAKHFNVSREAVFYRLAEKKVLNWKDKSKYLKNIKMIEEIPSSLVTNIDEQISKKFLINALKLYSEEKISSGKLAEWFFVDRITLMDYLEKFYKPTTAEFLITTES
ncbi:MAG: ImmA/IrrE family metallo-endopeptidase [Ignavibacteria bacterium]|nr:ImmA/IrrE family metallo-endopeptidase [Ignavibacteria bacterium]